MLDDDALWRAGRARGVDDVGRMARIEVERRRGVGPARDRRPVGVEPHDRGAAGRLGSGVGNRSSSADCVTSTGQPASASMKASRSRG